MFGWLILLIFWAFNALMLWWLVTGLGAGGRISATSEAERTGRDIGLFVGATMIFVIWGAGDVVLGLFVLLTRGTKVIIEDTPDDRHGPNSGASGNRQLIEHVDTSKWSRRDREAHERALAASRSRLGLAAPQRDLGRAAEAAMGDAPVRVQKPPRLVEDRGWRVEVVGESYYQEAILDALEDARDYGENASLIMVTLAPEPDNPHDRNAVRVTHRGTTVGYLPRAAAREYRLALGDQMTRCTGIIHGQPNEHDGQMNYGVWLGAAWPPVINA